MFSAHLKEILDDRVLAPRTNGGGMILREKEVMEVEVTETPSDVTAVDVRKIGSFSGLKDGEWKQSCDYLLVHERKGENVVIFVELKKTLNEKGMEQLRRSLPLLDYLHSVCRIQYGVESYKSEMTIRYSIICEKINPRLDKQPVTPGRPPRPEHYKGIKINKFVGSRVHFDLLRSDSTR